MDFKTTEASEDLGGLARTITESVSTPERQRELDGLDERFDSHPVEQADRSRHPVDGRAGVVGRRRIRSAGADRRPGRPWTADGRGAVPRVGRARRGCAGEVRTRRIAAGVGGTRDQRREDTGRGTRRRYGRGPGAGHGDRWRLPTDRHPHAGQLRPHRRRLPCSRRNRFGHQGFRRRVRRRRTDCGVTEHHRPRQRRTSRTARRRSGLRPDRRRR